jgi:hypothetical protein
MSGIGTLGEGPLHAALKARLAETGDGCERPVGGYVVDLVRPGELVEIQTGSFSRLKAKLAALLPEHRLRVVYPLAHETRLQRVEPDGAGGWRPLTERRSPKRRGVYHIFEELPAIAPWITHPNFRLEVISLRVLELRARTGRRVWRRQGWEIVERRLDEVFDCKLYARPADWLGLLPASLPSPFGTAELAGEAGISRELAQKVCYTLHGAGLLERVGRQGNAHRYERCEPAGPATVERTR